MKCFVCGNQQAKLIKRDHLFVESGLTSVTLKGCTFIACKQCGEEALQLRKPLVLMRAIARQLVFKPAPLTAEEVKFLRGHVGWSNQQVAEAMNVSVEQASRWTTGNGTGAGMGASAEELFRILIFIECMSPAELAKAVTEIKALVSREGKQKPKRTIKAKPPVPLKIRLVAA